MKANISFLLLLAVLWGLALPACTPKDTLEVQIAPELALGKQYDLTLSRTTKYVWNFSNNSNFYEFNYFLLLKDGSYLPFIRENNSASNRCSISESNTQSNLYAQYISTRNILVQKHGPDSLLLYLDCKRYVLPLHLKDAEGELHFVASLKSQTALRDSTSLRILLP